MSVTVNDGKMSLWVDGSPTVADGYNKQLSPCIQSEGSTRRRPLKSLTEPG